MAKVGIVLFSALAQVAGEKRVELDASTTLEAFETLKSKYGKDFNDKLFDESGKPKRFVNIYVNGRDIRFLNNLETSLKSGDTITLVPAVSGG